VLNIIWRVTSSKKEVACPALLLNVCQERMAQSAGPPSGRKISWLKSDAWKSLAMERSIGTAHGCCVSLLSHVFYAVRHYKTRCVSEAEDV
jgi:hypothetical protein